MKNIFFIIIIVLIIYVYLITYKDEVTYVKSSIDNKSYLVRNLADKEEAADYLAKIRIKIFKFKHNRIRLCSHGKEANTTCR